VPFGTATVLTNKGKAMFADRVGTSAATYTAPPKFVAMGTGATSAARTAAATDTALSSEQETRATGTETRVTTSVTGDTYQVVGTIAATSARAVDEGGLFDVVTSSSGNMGTSATFPVVNLANGDSLQFTWKVQIS
jgi:L-cysteine desulfidase